MLSAINYAQNYASIIGKALEFNSSSPEIVVLVTVGVEYTSFAIALYC